MIEMLIFLGANILIYFQNPRHIKRFKQRVGYFPNVAKPMRYNEMILWRKIFDHNPDFSLFCDKLATKSYIQQTCRQLAVPNTLWFGDNPRMLPKDLLQHVVFIKSNHACNRNLLISGNNQQLLPIETLEQWQQEIYGIELLEWGYRDARQLIFVEEKLVCYKSKPLLDISVHSFDGIAAFIELAIDPKGPTKRKGYFQVDGKRWKNLEQNAGNNSYSLDDNYSLPEIYKEAIKCASQLSEGVDYVRVDFMFNGQCLYGGEITVYPGSGMTNASEFSAYNKQIIKHWNIQKSWFCNTQHSGLLGLYSKVLNRWLQQREWPAY